MTNREKIGEKIDEAVSWVLMITAFISFMFWELLKWGRQW